MHAETVNINTCSSLPTVHESIISLRILILTLGMAGTFKVWHAGSLKAREGKSYHYYAYDVHRVCVCIVQLCVCACVCVRGDSSHGL
jgi:hypothetical protein